MKICVLASGSKGNCTYLETSTNKILIDIGISSLAVEKKLLEIGVNPKEIDSVFITHTHMDHISGLKIFCKKYNPKIYLSEKMNEEIKKTHILKNYEYIKNDLVINDIDITVIKTSHDTNDSNGYIFDCNNKTIAYITDTGYINIKNHEKLKNKTLYVMESNHDIELLMNGNRPHYLKHRILGDKGHLSNKDSAYYLSKFIGANTSCIVLAHLSEDNNSSDIARAVLEESLKKINKKVDKIVVADQNERTELIEI
jgi:phosphoribosyl 1,2-cyclic phosphodiesterase